MSTGARGGDLGEGNEEMQDHVEMEEDSTSNVPMLAASGTFIAGTTDVTVKVTETRHHAKRQRAAVHVSEDLLNRQIQDYGLVSPERAKNVVWCFFKKYGSKNLQGVDVNLKLSQAALCTICLADQTRSLHCTVKMGKDNSPSSLMDHMRIHHQDEFNAVVVANSKGVSLATFTAKRQEPRVRSLLGNSSVLESADNSPATADATPRAANAAGAALHEDSMARRSALQSLFLDTAAQQAGAPGKQRSMADVFKPSLSWTDKQDKQWKEELVSCVAEQYLPLAIVDAPAFRSMIQTLNPKASIPHRKGIVRKMSEMRALMEDEIVGMMRDEWVAITTDSWTSNAGQTYLGVSYHWIGADLQLRSMCVDCELLEGSTVGEELALKIPKAYSKREVAGVLLNCTDCEPTMCKMGRIVKADLGHDWQGCTDHRLEKTAAAFYKHKGVLACATKAKEIVTLIHTSSQVLIPVLCCVGALMLVIASVACGVCLL